MVGHLGLTLAWLWKTLLWSAQRCTVPSVWDVPCPMWGLQLQPPRPTSPSTATQGVWKEAPQAQPAFLGHPCSPERRMGLGLCTGLSRYSGGDFLFPSG